MSYNQKAPGGGGGGMGGGGGGLPPNAPNNVQQVAKTFAAGIQQQMQNLVHGQNSLQQTSQADLNAFLQQQRIQNMLKQQQFLHFQQQIQQQQQQHHHHHHHQQQQHQQHQQQQQHQQHQQQQHLQQQQQQLQQHVQHPHQHAHNMPVAGPVGGIVGPPASGGPGIPGAGGGPVVSEPLALTRTPGAAELLNKTYQQQANGNPTSNPALNQLHHQFQTLPTNLMQQLQAIQYQMHNAKLQHQQQQEATGAVPVGGGGSSAAGGGAGAGGVVVGQPSGSIGSQPHLQLQSALQQSSSMGHQTSPAQRLPTPQNALSAVAGLQQFQQRYLTAAAQAAAVSGQKLNASASSATPPPPPAPPAPSIPHANQLKATNHSTNPQLTPPSCGPPGIAQAAVGVGSNSVHQKTLVSPKTSQPLPPSLSLTTTKTAAAMATPAPALPAVAHQQVKFGGGQLPSMTSGKQHQPTNNAALPTTPTSYASNFPKTTSLLPPITTITSLPSMVTNVAGSSLKSSGANTMGATKPLPAADVNSLPPVATISGQQINRSAAAISGTSVVTTASTATKTTLKITTNTTTSSSTKTTAILGVLPSSEGHLNPILINEQNITANLSTETSTIVTITEQPLAETTTNSKSTAAGYPNKDADVIDNKAPAIAVPTAGTKSSNGLKKNQQISTTSVPNSADETPPANNGSVVIHEADSSSNVDTAPITPSNGSLTANQSTPPGDAKLLMEAACPAAVEAAVSVKPVPQSGAEGDVGAVNEKKTITAKMTTPEKNSPCKDSTITVTGSISKNGDDSSLMHKSSESPLTTVISPPAMKTTNRTALTAPNVANSSEHTANSGTLRSLDAEAQNTDSPSPRKIPKLSPGKRESGKTDSPLGKNCNDLSRAKQSANNSTSAALTATTTKSSKSPGAGKSPTSSPLKQQQSAPPLSPFNNCSPTTKNSTATSSSSGSPRHFETQQKSSNTTDLQSSLRNSNAGSSAANTSSSSSSGNSNSPNDKASARIGESGSGDSRKVNAGGSTTSVGGATVASGGSSSSKKSLRQLKTKLKLPEANESAADGTTSSVTPARTKRKTSQPNKDQERNKEKEKGKESVQRKANDEEQPSVSSAAKSASDEVPKGTPNTDRKSQRHRLKTILYQSPLPELAYITKLSASEASNSPKPAAGDDRLVVFYRHEYLAVRNAEGTFYLCQTLQNVYRTSPRISIRWLSQEPNHPNVFEPDFYDHTDIECVLTNVEMKRIDKSHLRLPKSEKCRIESILKKALDVEKGIIQRPELLTEENPDGLDISLYKDESQIERKPTISKAARQKAHRESQSAVSKLKKLRRGAPSRKRSTRSSSANLKTGKRTAATATATTSSAATATAAVETEALSVSSERAAEATTSNTTSAKTTKSNLKRKRTATNPLTTTSETVTIAENLDENLLSTIKGSKMAKKTTNIARKRGAPNKRKRKLHKNMTVHTDEEEAGITTDDNESDTDYKPNQKRATINSNVSRKTPRAQRSPLAKARAASPIVPSTSRSSRSARKSENNKIVGGETQGMSSSGAALVTAVGDSSSTPVAGNSNSTTGRSERASKRKAIATDSNTSVEESSTAINSSPKKTEATSNSKSKETNSTENVEKETERSKETEGVDKSSIDGASGTSESPNNSNKGSNVGSGSGNRSTRSSRK